MARTLYDVLMISPQADRPFMTVAYRHLAKRYHPDVDLSPEAAARMAELNEAYAILGDPTKRAAYDETIGLRPGLPMPSARDEAARPRRQHSAAGAGCPWRGRAPARQSGPRRAGAHVRSLPRLDPQPGGSLRP